MTDQPLVSIVVITYQHAAFIDAALGSVLEQDYRNIEVIVADDCSTDGAQERIREWAGRDGRIVLELAAANAGLSANWNRGLARCRGDLVALVSGDDQLLPGKLRKQVAFMQAHPECGISTHDMEIFDSATDRTLYRLHERFLPKNGGIETVFTTNWLFGRDVKAIPSSCMFRASAIGAHRYDPRLRIMNEWLFEIDCLARTGMQWLTLPEVLGRYRVHDDQLSRSPEAVDRGYEEAMITLAIAESRYPELAPLVRDKREFLLFRHLVLGWFPEAERAAFDRQFRHEAGFAKWLYMRAARVVIGRRWLVDASRPARTIVRRLQS